MLLGESVVLEDGTVCFAVGRVQRRQTRGWFVYWADDREAKFPTCREEMWPLTGSEDDHARASNYLILCPEDELDGPPKELHDPWFWDTSDVRPANIRPTEEEQGRTLMDILTPKAAEGSKKAPLHLVPPALAISAARALGEGADKYGAFDWRTRRPVASAYVAAMLRHLYAYMDGEDTDPDSEVGKDHLDGIAGSLAVLLDATHGGFLEDDRPSPGPAPRLLLKKD